MVNVIINLVAFAFEEVPLVDLRCVRNKMVEIIWKKRCIFSRQLRGDPEPVRPDGSLVGDGGSDVEHRGLDVLRDADRYPQHPDRRLHLRHLRRQEERAPAVAQTLRPARPRRLVVRDHVRVFQPHPRRRQRVVGSGHQIHRDRVHDPHHRRQMKQFRFQKSHAQRLLDVRSTLTLYTDA